MKYFIYFIKILLLPSIVQTAHTIYALYVYEVYFSQVMFQGVIDGLTHMFYCFVITFAVSNIINIWAKLKAYHWAIGLPVSLIVSINYGIKNKEIFASALPFILVFLQIALSSLVDLFKHLSRTDKNNKNDE